MKKKNIEELKKMTLGERLLYGMEEAIEHAKKKKENAKKEKENAR